MPHHATDDGERRLALARKVEVLRPERGVVGVGGEPQPAGDPTHPPDGRAEVADAHGVGLPVVVDGRAGVDERVAAAGQDAIHRLALYAQEEGVGPAAAHLRGDGVGFRLRLLERFAHGDGPVERDVDSACPRGVVFAHAEEVGDRDIEHLAEPCEDTRPQAAGATLVALDRLLGGAHALGEVLLGPALRPPCLSDLVLAHGPSEHRHGVTIPH